MWNNHGGKGQEATGLQGLGQDWPEPVEILRPDGASNIVLLCEHASNHLPAEYRHLGLTTADLVRHIAWDIGAADVTQRLSDLLDAPAFLGTYSRLLIDLNRRPGIESSIPSRSEDTDIIGNRNLPEAERERRIQRIFRPYHDALGEFLDRRQSSGRSLTMVSIHSFEPVFLGDRRPWHAGVLYDGARTLGRLTIERLAADRQLIIGDNQPYSVSPDEDYALFEHGARRGIAAILVEVRNDELLEAVDRQRWAERLAQVLYDPAA